MIAHALRLTEMTDDGAVFEWTTRVSLAYALRMLVDLARELYGLGDATVWRYDENIELMRTIASRRELRVIDQTAEELDHSWMENLCLSVQESDPGLFAWRCANALRPAVHAGHIFANELEIYTLAYDACEPESFSFQMPRNVCFQEVMRRLVSDYATRFAELELTSDAFE